VYELVKHKEKKNTERMTFHFNKWCRSITMRASLLVLIALMRISSFVCLSVRSIEERSANVRLVHSTMVEFITLGVLGLFLSDWSESWPNEDGSFTAIDLRGKWLFLIHSYACTWGLFVNAMNSVLESEANNELMMVTFFLQFAGSMLMQLVAVDVYSDRRTNDFIFGTLTTKSSEKNSDREIYIELT